MQKNNANTDDKQWGQAVESMQHAMTHASQAGSHAVTAISEMAEQACCGLGEKADDLAAAAGSNVKQLGATMTEKNPPNGVIGCVSNAIAGSVVEGGEYLQTAKLSGIVGDVSGVIKRNPLPSVFAAVCLGWLLGTATRK